VRFTIQLVNRATSQSFERERLRYPYEFFDFEPY
jgi:hypothetical protein